MAQTAEEGGQASPETKKLEKKILAAPTSPPVLALEEGMRSELESLVKKEKEIPEIDVSLIGKKASETRDSEQAEKIRRFAEYARFIIRHLPPEERQAFADDPIHFVSKKMVFRGLKPHAYKALKEKREYVVVSAFFEGCICDKFPI